MQKIDLNGKSVLVTGSPGFIGANLVLRLLKEMNGGTVVSLDNMNDYYDPALKEYRLNLIERAAKDSLVEHIFVRGSIADKALVDALFTKEQPFLLLDDPFVNLDDARTKRALELLQKISQQRQVVYLVCNSARV